MSQCPIEAIDCTLAFATKDWSLDKNDAFIYGVVAGWDEASLQELKLKFRWTDAYTQEIRDLHVACERLRV